MSGRTITTSAAPSVSEEQIEQARARKIVTVAKDGGLELERVKKEYWALCCFHEEATPSLAFNPEKNVFFCHGCQKGGGVIDFVMARDTLDFPEAVLKLAGEPQPAAAKPAPGRIVAEYLYPGSDGVARHRVTKHDPKDFRPWHRTPDGSWQIGEGGEKMPPYRLPELLAADPAAWVAAVEGEKDVERLRALGFIATTNAGGAGKWRPEHSEHLRGRRVCIIPDNDDAGERHAEKVARSLAGVASEIRILRLPNLPAKGDVSDYLDTGATADDLTRRIEDAPAWGPATDESAAAGEPKASRLVIRTMSGIAPKETDWLWKRWLPRGKLGLLAGLAGDGKSTLLAQIAAIGSVAGVLPDGAQAPLFRTLFMLGEDALDDTLRPRLDLHGADTDHVFAIETVLDGDGNHRFFNAEKHLPLLEEAIGDYRIDMVGIDPLTTITPGTDRNAEGATRDSLTPLIKLADRRNVAIVGIAHVGKPSPGNRTAAQRILGATAIHALARVILMTARADDDRMVLGVVKSNLAMKPEPLIWTRAEDGPITWHGVSDQNVEDLLQGAVSKAPRADAEGFLRELLMAGSMASADVEQKAKDGGIAWATLRRAADTIGVVKWKQGGADGRWFWRLPDGQPAYADKSPEDDTPNLLTPLHSDVSKLSKFHDDNLLNGAESEQVHATTPIPTNGATNVMEGAQLAHIDVLRSEQVPNGAADTLPADCLTPAMCGGKLGRCARAPRCRVASAAVGATP